MQPLKQQSVKTIKHIPNIPRSFIFLSQCFPTDRATVAQHNVCHFFTSSSQQELCLQCIISRINMTAKKKEKNIHGCPSLNDMLSRKRETQKSARENWEQHIFAGCLNTLFHIVKSVSSCTQSELVGGLNLASIRGRVCLDCLFILIQKKKIYFKRKILQFDEMKILWEKFLEKQVNKFNKKKFWKSKKQIFCINLRKKKKWVADLVHCQRKKRRIELKITK